jgi:hypothetical protein
MKLTTAQFQAITRFHFGVGPRPWIGKSPAKMTEAERASGKYGPHISVADLGRGEFDRVTGWWGQWAMWNAWLESGKKGPRPKAWRLSLPVSAFAWQLRREWRKAFWSPPAVPPGPQPVPPPPGDSRYVRMSFGAQNPLDALMWHNCEWVGFTADPNSAYGQWITRANGDLVRRAGKKPFIWYVPDQIGNARAREAASIIGTDEIWCDIETLGRFRLSVEQGVMKGIANLSALWEDGEADRLIRASQYKIVNEFYWNQAKYRKPDNHNLPVSSLCIAVYDGHSDSQEADAWEPHVHDYAAGGYLWNTVSVYSVNMTPADWAQLP